MKLDNTKETLDYRDQFPQENEDRESYCRRLEADGYQEMYIRKALRCHFAMSIKEFGDFFEPFERARLRHITLLHRMHPNRTDYALTKKVQGSLEVSEERAAYWVKRFREVGEVDYKQ